MTMLTHLDWQPVILLKVVRIPFGGWGGLSLKRAYIALHDDRLLYADWTLEAAERAEALVCATGWTLPTLPDAPIRLDGKGAKVIPTGTWVLPYEDAHYQLYERVRLTIHAMLEQVEKAPTNAQTLHMLTRWIA